MAAGLGKRMGSPLPKVMQPVCGRPMIGWVLRLCEEAGVSDVVVVVNPLATPLHEYLASYSSTHLKIHTAIQAEAKGTGHAVLMALPVLKSLDVDHVLILSGDVPNLRKSSVVEMCRKTESEEGLVMLTAILKDAKAYGRILRDESHNVVGILEFKDCNPEQRQIREINAGIYLAPYVFLSDALPMLNNHNKAGEYYLTDIVAIASGQKMPIHAVVLEDANEASGANTPEELAALEAWRRKQEAACP